MTGAAVVCTRDNVAALGYCLLVTDNNVSATDRQLCRSYGGVCRTKRLYIGPVSGLVTGSWKSAGDESNLLLTGNMPEVAEAMFTGPPSALQGNLV